MTKGELRKARRLAVAEGKPLLGELDWRRPPVQIVPTRPAQRKPVSRDPWERYARRLYDLAGPAGEGDDR